LERFLTQFISQDLVESTPPTVAYKIWCPYPRLSWNAPSLRTIMKRKATDALEDQPLSTYKRSASKNPKSKAKKIPLPQADEQQLKSLADAAIDVPSSSPRFFSVIISTNLLLNRMSLRKTVLKKKPNILIHLKAYLSLMKKIQS
jgi:hypothetical protein